MSFALRLLRPKRSGTSKTSMVIDGKSVPVTLRRNANARRFILRLDKSGEGIVVTLPPHGSDRAAMEFAAGQANWIMQQQGEHQPAACFTDGGALPLRGVEHIIRHVAKTRGTVWVSDDRPPQLCVAGRPEHMARRLKDWLKAEARRDLDAASRSYADAMGLKFNRITIRDQSSRWGSCSSSGGLSYSWRLILAPEFVLDYVAAHEVAHLREMNHSRRFWSLVEAHCPHTARARAWLKHNGRSLHRHGA
jgi:predicted metal-dependent hydrolase